ncbi:hypothetical protein P7D66_14830 [Enterococcus avium]|uniref:hypothetical protein n=1 Tax=Enterococcus avium TaxID=33945 RepID=UPI00288E9C83|nr:hypothetical protein [Enterococcus avium]MDT2423653.1 hypothetical protein [Enterococcus avium]
MATSERTEEMALNNLSKFRLKVFISSAMGEENGTTWISIREAVKQKLLECDYLEPFTIEDHASEIPSTQFFTWKVTDVDVVVILIKDDIRAGTKQEIEKALEKRKPLLVYFYDSGKSNQSVEDFKKRLISSDRVTFKGVKSFNNIDEIVFNDVINNLINYYRFTHDSSTKDVNNVYVSSEGYFEDNILEKSYLTFFGNNKKALCEFFQISKYVREGDEVNENKNGLKLLEWLYKGDTFINEKDVDDIYSELSLPEEVAEVLMLRHKSVHKYFLDDLEGAMFDLNNAYDLAENKKIPNWLLGDILIDCRNIQSKLEPRNSNYQDKIIEMDNFIHYPVGDRFLKQAFEILEKERFEIRTLPVSTVRFGNTLVESLQCVENYLYISFVIGSSTHLLLARKKMIEFLLEYGELYEDENLIYQALRLLILAGEVKMFTKTLEKYWSDVSDILAINVDHLWELTEGKYCINSKIIKCLIIKSLGQFMNNTLFRTSTTFLSQYSQEIERYGQANYLLDAVNNNIKRINYGFILDIVINILDSNRVYMHSYSSITKILFSIEFVNCDDSDITRLADTLKEKIFEIINNGGSPFFIINLLKQRYDDFVGLYDVMKEKLTDDQIDGIEIELGNDGKAIKVLIEKMQILEKRFETMNGVEFGYGDDPLLDIVEIIKEFNSPKIISIFNEKFFPLVINVLSSNVALEVKEPYLKSLVTVLVEYKKIDQDISETLINFFSSNKIELKDEFAITQVSTISSMYYINTINSLLNIDTEKDIFMTCVGYSEKSGTERQAFSYSIQKYLEFNIFSHNEIPLFISLVVFEMLRDSDFVVRKNAITCLLLIYKSDPSEIYKGELIRMTLDSSPNVKGHYISMLEEENIKFEDARELLNLFLKDASYTIRTASQKKLDEIG